MGTRGFMSFAANGETKTAYVNNDSYPGGLGVDILDWLRSTTLDFAKQKAAELRVVGDDTEPTDADIERLKVYANSRVGDRSDRMSWYQLLRETQGDPAATLAAGVMEDSNNFPADSLYAEWGYVVDFDAMAFEVYRGFQTVRHRAGRFADLPQGRNRDYFPVRLVKSWPLSDLPDNAAFLAVEEDNEDD